MKTMVLEHPRMGSREHFNDIANTPLWSCLMGGYAASALSADNREAIYLDASERSWDFDRTLHLVLGQAPSLLCINAVYFWEHTPALFQFILDLRKEGFDSHINLFGFYPTLAPSDLLRAAPVNSIAVGECENTLRELAHALSRGKQWRDIEGLAFDPETAHRVHRSPVKNPDGFAFPQRPETIESPACILASRGCYNQCGFCLVPPFYNRGPLWRGRSVQNILSEILELRQRGCHDFYFVDPNFIGPGKAGRERCIGIAEGLRRLKIRFGMETRPNDLTESILYRLREAGLKTLLLGIESGSANMLQRIGKNATRDLGARAIALCRDAGIEPEIGFIMFLAETSLSDIRENLKFLHENRLLDRLDRTANLLGHRQIVLKGTSGYAGLARKGKLEIRGVMGFEGLARHEDPRVQWLAETSVFACHWVLKKMGQQDSPVHWRAPEGPIHERLNNALTERFKQLLRMASKEKELPDPPLANAETEARFEKQLPADLA